MPKNNINKTKLPGILLYSKYLSLASLKFKISIEKCRSKFGLYSIEQWENLLAHN